MSLLDEMRTRVRVTSDLTDDEIDGEILAAIADMRRCGVKDVLLNADAPDPLVKHAVAMYCRAYYGYDNAERPQFIAAYERTLCDLLNSKANEYLFPDEETEPDDGGAADDPTEGDDDGTATGDSEPTDDPTGGDDGGAEGGDG